ncbi:MAG TPA: TatD family hydrolase [Acidobacteriota bacterium]|nr:TatD family hydrolase [Acidobacteriota bacterium]
MRLVDSHAHLTDERFDVDRSELLARAAAAGVEAVVVIGYNVESSHQVVELVGAHDNGGDLPALYGTVGFAPHNVAEADASARAEVRELLSRPRIVGVGEIGLDYHYDMPPDEQRELFGDQLQWAVERRLPVVVHSREAEDDVVAMIRDAGAEASPERARLRGVIHCFTESERMAAAAVDAGFYVSFSGILTFGNAEDLRRSAATVPLERTLIETDAPYLAPVPHRGKRNEPAFVEAVAETLAAIHGVDVEEVATVTAANCRTLFGLDPQLGVAPQPDCGVRP